MKLSRTLLALLPLALAAPLAAQGFEGTMKQMQITIMPQGVATLAGAELTDPAAILEALTTKAKGADASLVQTQDMSVSVKGTKLRVDGMAGVGPGAYSIMDATAAMMYTVVPQQKQVIVLAGADAPVIAKFMTERMGAPAPSTTPPTTTDLGMKQVGGVMAHGYRLVTPDGVGVVWVDPAMKTAFSAFTDFQQKMSALNPGTGQLQAAISALGFPVEARLVVKAPAMMGQGWLYSETIVSQVQKQPVADAVFTVPADFTQVNMKQMMGIN